MIPNRVDPREATQSLFTRRYPTADCLLLCGSIVRGEATATSDLDIVVLYADLPHAYRESLVWEGYPVEAFVHSPPTPLSTARRRCVTSLKKWMGRPVFLF